MLTVMTIPSPMLRVPIELTSSDAAARRIVLRPSVVRTPRHRARFLQASPDQAERSSPTWDEATLQQPQPGDARAPPAAVRCLQAGGTRFKCPRSVGADRGRAASAAAAVHPPVVPPRSPGNCSCPATPSVRGERDRPQAGRLLTQPLRRPVPGSRPPGGGVKTGLHPIGRMEFAPARGAVVPSTLCIREGGLGT